MMKEVQIQSSFNHKNILKLYSVKENFDYLFLVMEIVEGGTLKELIEDRYYSKSEFFTDYECSLIIKNILEGLNYIHSKKIIHRDIKPGMFIFLKKIENIMFKNKKDFNSLKITDFGFSTVCDDDRETVDCGTLIYKSPEQISGKFYDSYIDTWATGYILYILLSGGSHPLYINGMTYDEYVNKFKSQTEWNFPPQFPMY